MNCIHVEPELLFETARVIWQRQAWMRQELQELRALLTQLETVWRSPASVDWLDKEWDWVRRAEAHLEKLDMLALLLHHQAEKWQETDARGCQTFDSLRRKGSA